MRLASIALLTMVAGICGCGSGGSFSADTAANPLTLTGNWALTLVPSTAPRGNRPMAMVLTTTGADLSGTFVNPLVTVNDLACFDAFENIFHLPMQGTLDSHGNIALQSSSSNPSLSINAETITGDTFEGTYSMVSCPSSQGTISGTLIVPVNGIYAGTLTTTTGSQVGVAVTFDQSSTFITQPGTPGFFPLSGSAVFTGPTCFATGAQTSGTLTGGGVTGNLLAATFPSAPSVGSIYVGATIAPDARTLAFQYSAGGSPGTLCQSYEGASGTLTRQ
jgi:hypothetical protein